MSTANIDVRAGAILLLKVLVAGAAAYGLGILANNAGAGVVTIVVLFLLTYLVLAYAMK